MRILLGTTPVKVDAPGRSRAVVQNLGPGVVYLDTQGSVSPDSGLQVPATGAYEFPTSGADDEIFIVSTVANTDVRVILVG